MTVAAAIESLPYALNYFQEDWQNPAVEDIFVNDSGRYFARIAGRVVERKAPELDALAIKGIAKLALHVLGKYVDEELPIADCALPTGERLNVVLHPCTPYNSPAMSLRRSQSFMPTLDWLESQGLWDALRDKETKRARQADTRGIQARKLRDAGDINALIRLGLQLGWTFAFVGMTSAGKTFDGKAIIMEIPQTPDERLIFVSDAEEFAGAPHPNKVHMVWNKNDSAQRGEALIEAALRMGPRRIIVPEIRDEMAFALLRALFVSPGITSWHARSAVKAFDSVAAMIRQHHAGRAMPEEVIREILRNFINVVIHVERDYLTGKFIATDVQFGEDLQ